MSALTEVQALSLPDESTLSAGANAALRMAESFTIATTTDYELAADELKAIKSKAKALEERRVAITGPLNKAMKAVNDLFRAPLAALDQAEGIIKRSMIAYTEEQQRKAEEERKRLEAEAAAERKRLEDEARAREEAAAAEAKRLADEAAVAAAAGNQQAAAEAQAQAEQVQQAAAAEAAAMQATAAVMTAPVVPIAAAPKAAGVSKVKVTYKAEIDDKMAFLQFVASRPDMAMLVDVNMSKLNGLARAQGPAMNYPGVRVVEEKSIAARAA